jgi:hypothetical protein
MGTATNPVVTYRNANGETEGAITCGVTLGANDYLSIDMDARTLTKYTDGVSSNGLSLISAGTFFDLDPAHGDPAFSAWPTLATSAGTGVAFYRKAYS